MSCCTNTLLLDPACLDSCSTIVLPFTYNADGKFTFLFTTSFTTKHSQDGLNGGDIEIDLSLLLESAEYTLQILDPTGTAMTYTVNGVEYNCFKFKTYIAKEV